MDEKVVPSLLARVHEQEDQHEYQADSGGAQREQDDRSEQESHPSDRPAVVEPDKLKIHQPHPRPSGPYGEAPPHKEAPAHRERSRGDLDDPSDIVGEAGGEVDDSETK
jgi:hypothetical protein